MPRVAKTVERVLPETSLIIDNGGSTLKAGYASATPNLEDCFIIPNCLAKDRAKRLWIGGQLSKCQDFGEIAFRRPVDKGFLVNWEAEKAIWDNTFLEKSASTRVSFTEYVEVRISDIVSSAIPM